MVSYERGTPVRISCRTCVRDRRVRGGEGREVLGAALRYGNVWGEGRTVVSTRVPHSATTPSTLPHCEACTPSVHHLRSRGWGG